MITGRAPLDAWDAAVKKYLGDGGSKIAEEFATEYAAAN